jgi:GDP-mannose 6-dehydrogenase
MGRTTTISTVPPKQLAVFGLGYVGAVTAACLAERGNMVIGVDSNPDKVKMITAGRTPVIEEGLEDLISSQVASGRLVATTDARSAIEHSDMAMICVGTPSNAAGGLNTTFLERVITDIGDALRETNRHGYVVVVRSTVFPGTVDEVIIPALEKASGFHVGVEVRIATNPEFLREGSSIADFHTPPKTVVGCDDAVAGEQLLALYDGLPGPRWTVPIRVAEMVKYADNSFHALKVGFANEIGALCKESSIDSHLLMELFCDDRKLNISPAYLKPGFAFGGSCLPKDLRAILHAARHRDLVLPILESILPSNDLQVSRCFDVIERTGAKRVGLFGLSFKSGTDDLRESPLVALAERLLGRGIDLRICDSQVRYSNLYGANRAYVEDRLPHLSTLLVETPAEIIEHAEAVVLATGDAAVIDTLLAASPLDLIDLVRPARAADLAAHHRYYGASW